MPAETADPSPPTLALAMVVRDEERFLADNLAYHLALGVGKIYVYLDRCADRSPQIARSFPAAEVVERDRRPDEAFMSQYQTAVLADALGRARRDGFDWLLHVDADEFAWGENDAGLFARVGRDAGPAARGSLPGLVRRAATRLRGRGRRVDQIILRTVENVPTPLAEGETFADLRWFQDNGVLPRDVLDPTTRQVRRLDDWLGARRGKSLVRVAADVAPASAHGWTRADGKSLVTARAGLHYHFVVTDWRHWLEKYRKFSEYPARWEKGNAVRFPKQAWKEASRRMNDAEAKAYFEGWVAGDAAELARSAGAGAGRCLRWDDTIATVLAAARRLAER